MMITTNKRFFKLFWVWQDDKEEAWLRDMARQGWHMTGIDFPGRYSFTAGEPRDDVYRLDFNTDSKNWASYQQLFEDTGWEFVTTFGSWHYFRTTARPGEDTEIYTDNASKVAKYQRVIAILIVFFPVLVIFQRSSQSLGNQSSLAEVVEFVLFLVWSAILILYIYAMLKLIRRISQLKRLGE